jgi:hypothetical protein
MEHRVLKHIKKINRCILSLAVALSVTYSGFPLYAETPEAVFTGSTDASAVLNNLKYKNISNNPFLLSYKGIINPPD